MENFSSHSSPLHHLFSFLLPNEVEKMKKYANFHLSSPVFFFSLQHRNSMNFYRRIRKKFLFPTLIFIERLRSTKMHVSVVYSYFVREEFKEFPVEKEDARGETKHPKPRLSAVKLSRWLVMSIQTRHQPLR